MKSFQIFAWLDYATFTKDIYCINIFTLRISINPVLVTFDYFNLLSAGGWIRHFLAAWPVWGPRLAWEGAIRGGRQEKERSELTGDQQWSGENQDQWSRAGGKTCHYKSVKTNIRARSLITGLGSARVPGPRLSSPGQCHHPRPGPDTGGWHKQCEGARWAGTCI